MNVALNTDDSVYAIDLEQAKSHKQAYQISNKIANKHWNLGLGCSAFQKTK